MNKLADIVRTLKYNYLFAQGEAGGHAADFVDNYIQAWFDVPGNSSIVQAHLLDAMKAVANKQWSEKLSSAAIGQGNLDINGRPAPIEIRYKDMGPKEQRVPGGYITVLTEYATVQHWFWYWQSVQTNANTQVVVAQKIYEQYEWMMDRAGGKINTKIVDLI